MIALASLILNVIEEVPEPPQPVPLIYDTDMGNDLDRGPIGQPPLSDGGRKASRTRERNPDDLC